jgi:hypothetical protein
VVRWQRHGGSLRAAEFAGRVQTGGRQTRRLSGGTRFARETNTVSRAIHALKACANSIGFPRHFGLAFPPGRMNVARVGKRLAPRRSARIGLNNFRNKLKGFGTSDSWRNIHRQT